MSKFSPFPTTESDDSDNDSLKDSTLRVRSYTDRKNARGDSWYSLPRGEHGVGGVAYAAQEAWVQNETIRVCFSPTILPLIVIELVPSAPG